MLKKNQKDFCKVITLVLHFGNRRWEGDKELQEIIKKQSGEEEWFQNYKLNVVDIAYLTNKDVSE